ncbi:MAG: hypothetical protein MJ252_18080 [archaeon]|nr:hypothetical protein [archaeon]
MKNKESKRPSSVAKSQKTNKTKGTAPQNGPSKSQINRLKRFYNTTRWLPNSAFTTYFGKPAFENYGYGNTNPVYGGLFYGNYMLSHNMNPIDGKNHPPEKQVYSSAMMKSLQRQQVRRPSPPRKVPDEIRNTPDELEEMRNRCQIFQLPNEMPSRDIIPPNLIKARYFRSGKNTPEGSEDENADEYEDFNVENVLAGKKNKKRKVNKIKDPNFNPYKQGKIQLGKKIMKVGLDNKLDPALAEKIKEKRRKLGLETGDDFFEEMVEEQESEETMEYNFKKKYYEMMLGEDGVKNLENLKDVNIYTKEIEEERKNKELEEQKVKEEQEEINEKIQQEQIEKEGACPLCHQTQPMKGSSLLKKKENPALYAPGQIGNGFVCCIHHSKEMIRPEDRDPRNFHYMPPCMLESVAPAGRPTRKEEPLNLFG